ncbi:MAG: hypothetical protein ACUVR8_03640 [Acidobacteriota bacterium]
MFWAASVFFLSKIANLNLPCRRAFADTVTAPAAHTRCPSEWRALPGNIFSENWLTTIAFHRYPPYDGGIGHLLLLINGDVPRFGLWLGVAVSDSQR